MPTVIVLDTSGTMNIPMPKSPDGFTPMQFAYSGLHSFLDVVASSSKLEFVALVRVIGHFYGFRSYIALM